MKLLNIFIAALIPLTISCASTKEYRDEHQNSTQQTLDNTCFVRIVNKTGGSITYSYMKANESVNPNLTNSNSFNTNNQNNNTYSAGLNLSLNKLNSSEDQLIKVRKNDSIKVRYTKSGQEVEEEIKVLNDKRLEVSPQGIKSNDMLKTDISM